MVVEMADRLAGTLTDIGDYPETAPGHTLIPRHLLYRPVDGHQQLAILRPEVKQGANVLTRDNQDMDRRNRADIAESYDQVIAINDVALDRACRNRTKDAVHVPLHLHPRYQAQKVTSSANWRHPDPTALPRRSHVTFAQTPAWSSLPETQRRRQRGAAQDRPWSPMTGYTFMPNA
jgi:hypothetical protein